MSSDSWKLIGITVQDLPPEIVDLRVKWRDAPPDIDWNLARTEIKRLLTRLVPHSELTDVFVVTVSDPAKDYPTLAKVAETIVIGFESQLGRDLRKIAADYTATGGRQLSREEIEQEVAERRGAA